MSLLLVLNAAEARLQYVLAEGDTFLCAGEWAAPTQGTEKLAPLLQQALDGLGRTPRDLARIACVTGPGSFTGIRLVLTTAAALRRATGALLAPISYTRALAATVTCPAGTCLRVLTRARRGLVHLEDFVACADAPPCPLDAHGPRLATPDEAARLPEPAGARPEWLLVGSGVRELVGEAGAEANAPGSEGGLARATLLPLAAPASASLLALAQVASYAAHDLDPVYVRSCDAVDNLSAIAARRGDDPAAAHAALSRLLAASPRAE